MNKYTIPVLDDEGLVVVDTIYICATLFDRDERPDWENSNPPKVNIFFSPKNTSRKYKPDYVNTLQKKKDDSKISMVYIEDRNTLKMKPEIEAKAMDALHTYLIKNKDSNIIHPILMNEAKRRGVFAD